MPASEKMPNSFWKEKYALAEVRVGELEGEVTLWKATATTEAAIVEEFKGKIADLMGDFHRAPAREPFDFCPDGFPHRWTEDGETDHAVAFRCVQCDSVKHVAHDYTWETLDGWICPRTGEEITSDGCLEASDGMAEMDLVKT